MKRKIILFASIGILAVSGLAYGFSETEKGCPLEGTPECPKNNCPLAGTPDCPFENEGTADFASCCKKK